MIHRLILKVTKFQLSPPKRLSTVVKNVLGSLGLDKTGSDTFKSVLIYGMEQELKKKKIHKHAKNFTFLTLLITLDRLIK